MSQNLPVILVEVVVIFGGVLAFGWWQLRDVRKAQAEAKSETERERERARRLADEAQTTQESFDAKP